MEEKELNEEKKSQKTVKKPPAKFYKEGKKRKVEAIIDNELKKKIEKAESLSKDKKEGVKKEKKVLKYKQFRGLVFYI